MVMARTTFLLEYHVKDVGSIVNAGGVEVLYGSSSGLSATSPVADQFWTQNSANVNDIAEVGDQFGFSLSSGDFNGDGKDDLATSADFNGDGKDDLVSAITGEDLSILINFPTVKEAGGVEVLGSSTGLSSTSPLADQFWSQHSTDVNDYAEENDTFGLSLK
jgi:uncharacterized glyoxalase superfamily protein PhnB